MSDAAGDATMVILEDGAAITVRPIERADDRAFADAVDRAGSNDLRKRFLGTALPASTLLHYLHRADGLHDLVLGAFAAGGRVVGVVQCDRRSDIPEAEFAIEVAGDYQHRGLGGLLLGELERRALSIGLTTLTASYYSDNLAIRQLLADTGQVVQRSHEAGVSTAILEIADGGSPTTSQDLRTYRAGRRPLVDSAATA